MVSLVGVRLVFLELVVRHRDLKDSIDKKQGVDLGIMSKELQKQYMNRRGLWINTVLRKMAKDAGMLASAEN